MTWVPLPDVMAMASTVEGDRVVWIVTGVFALVASLVYLVLWRKEVSGAGRTNQLRRYKFSTFALAVLGVADLVRVLVVKQ
jgi:hypothetical protein